MARLAFAAVCTSLLVAAGSTSAEPFVLECALPFESIKKDRQIDHLCPARGDMPLTGGSDQDRAHAHQNLAKNNFCATGPPALVTFISFKKLQQKLEQKVPKAKTWWRENLPRDRSVLVGIHKTTEGTTIGEGSLVTFAAWLMMIRQQGKESCNCEHDEDDSMVDRHLVLIRSFPSMACCTSAAQKTTICKSRKEEEQTLEDKSVTAEISPHFRPDQWDEATICKAASHHPLRFTGRLMYDAAHRPGHGPPRRFSSWEIHPVYAIDVCSEEKLNSCKADDNSVWVPLDQWHGE